MFVYVRNKYVYRVCVYTFIRNVCAKGYVVGKKTGLTHIAIYGR